MFGTEVLCSEQNLSGPMGRPPTIKPGQKWRQEPTCKKPYARHGPNVLHSVLNTTNLYECGCVLTLEA